MSKTKIPRRSVCTTEGNKEIKSKFAPRNSEISTRNMKLKEKSSLNVESNSLESKKSFFKVIPTEKLLALQSLPSELKGKPRIIGNEAQLEALFNHTKEIAHTVFAKAQYNILFPSFLNTSSISRLSFLSNTSRSSTISTNSKIPIMRKSSIAPDTDIMTKEPSEKELAMRDAFELLNSILSKQKSTINNLSGFFILYVGLILAICTQKAAKNALDFLSTFLEFKSTKTQEVNILFAVLIRVCDSAPELRDTVIDCLAKLAKLEPSLAKRLENGSTHHDASLSSLCNDVFVKLGRNITEKKEIFTSISDTADIDCAIDQLGVYVETLEDNGQPSDIIDFVRNIISVMNRFSESAIVLQRAANCVESIIPFCEDLPIELTYNCLSLCFSIMSGEMFLNGENAFTASEAIQSLTRTIFDSIPPQDLIPALTSILKQKSKSDDNSKIKMVLDNIESYVRLLPNDLDATLLDQIYEALDSFHPEIKKPSFCTRKSIDPSENVAELEDSIRKLNSPDTILDEINSLVEKSTDCDFSSYPSYLIPMLQIAWIIKNRDAPLNENNADPLLYDNVHKIMARVDLLDDDQIDESEFGLPFLQNELKDLMDLNEHEEIEIQDDI